MMTDEQKQLEEPLTPLEATEPSSPASAADRAVPEAPETPSPDIPEAATPEIPVEVPTAEQIIDALTQEVASLTQQLGQQTQQNDALKQRYITQAAEFDNFRKRTQKEKEDLEIQIKCKTINELLPVIDNFERARTQIKPGDDGEMIIHKSYQGVYKNLVDSLKRLGVSPMRPEGEPFDPLYHDAMLREATNEYPEDTVLEELERGYILGDRVLRHAKVKVAVPTEDETAVPNPTPTPDPATDAPAE